MTLRVNNKYTVLLLRILQQKLDCLTGSWAIKVFSGIGFCDAVSHDVVKQSWDACILN